MTIARGSTIAGIIVGTMLLAACQSAGPAPGPAAGSVDGSWTSADGAAAASFSGGSYSSTSSRTGNKLEEGSYVVSGATVQIIGTSVLTQKPVNYSCLLASPKQLNCSSSGGQSFALIRKA
jgi:hypothetical protein